jgi:hypothetical protein
VLVNLNIGRYEVLPDILGLTVLFFCAVLFTDRAGRFARPAVVSAVMVFLEVVRLFALAGSDMVTLVISMLYAFLQVVLVITLADGVAQFAQLQGDDRTPRLCDVTGHIYALTFVFSIITLGGWFTELHMIFNLAYHLITAYTVIMFLYFYTSVHIPLQEHELPFFEYRGPDTEEEGMEGLDGIESLQMVGELEGMGEIEEELTLEIDPTVEPL